MLQDCYKSALCTIDLGRREEQTRGSNEGDKREAFFLPPRFLPFCRESSRWENFEGHRDSSRRPSNVRRPLDERRRRRRVTFSQVHPRCQSFLYQWFFFLHVEDRIFLFYPSVILFVSLLMPFSFRLLLSPFSLSVSLSFTFQQKLITLASVISPVLPSHSFSSAFRFSCRISLSLFIFSSLFSQSIFLFLCHIICSFHSYQRAFLMERTRMDTCPFFRPLQH